VVFSVCFAFLQDHTGWGERRKHHSDELLKKELQKPPALSLIVPKLM
jgi:hypothetical protein